MVEWGIGTASPLKTLSVNGGDIAVNNGNSFIVGAAITGNTKIGELGADSGQLRLLTESTRDIKFASTTYGNIMFLEGTNGYVGIGTTDVQHPFDVYTNTSAKYVGRFTQDHSSGYGVLIDVDSTSVNQPALWVKNANTTSIWAGSNGNVGIGTTNPSQKLDVNGAVLAGDYRGSSHIYLTSPDSWIFRSTGGSDRMRITSAGNVGIGTTSPNGTLTVVSNNAYNSGGGLRLQSQVAQTERCYIYLQITLIK